MIADTLFDTRMEIAYYLETFPECYADLRPQLDALCATMAALQAQLDTPVNLDDLAALQEGASPDAQ